MRRATTDEVSRSRDGTLDLYSGQHRLNLPAFLQVRDLCEGDQPRGMALAADASNHLEDGLQNLGEDVHAHRRPGRQVDDLAVDLQG